MLEDFRLKVFMAVAEEGSFTKAAAVLGISQPAVSQNVAELEKMTGTRLFERLRGEITLTPQGTVFKEYATGILESCTAAGNMFVKLPQSVVRISASEEIFSFYIAPALKVFMSVHPEVSFERSIFDDADVAVVMQPSSDSPFEVPVDAIARIKVSRSGVPAPGVYKTTLEKSMYFDLLWKPTKAFSCTHICRLLKETLSSF